MKKKIKKEKNKNKTSFYIISKLSKYRRRGGINF